MMKCIRTADFGIGFDFNGNIKDDKYFISFYTDEKPDITVKVCIGEFPVYKIDRCFEQAFHTFCISGNLKLIYSNKIANDRYNSLAVINGTEITVYVCKGITVSDSFLFNAVYFPYLLTLYKMGIFHCSFIDYNGEAILFTGDKGSGKSTQALLWNKQRNCEIINGDRAILFVKNNRLYASGVPYCGSSDISVNKILPVKSVVLLNKSEKNKVRFNSAKENFLNLFNKFSYNVYDYDSVFNITDLTSFIINNTNCPDFYAVNDVSAVDFLERELCKTEMKK